MRLGGWIVTLTMIGWYNLTKVEEMKPTITPIDSHAGLYFDEIGQIFFYPTKWKAVSYVNLTPTQSLWRQVKAQQFQIVNYCMKIRNATWYHLTDCSAFTLYIGSKVKYVKQLKDIIADYLSSESGRV